MLIAMLDRYICAGRRGLRVEEFLQRGYGKGRQGGIIDGDSSAPSDVGLVPPEKSNTLHHVLFQLL